MNGISKPGKKSQVPTNLTHQPDVQDMSCCLGPAARPAWSSFSSTLAAISGRLGSSDSLNLIGATDADTESRQGALSESGYRADSWAASANPRNMVSFLLPGTLNNRSRPGATAVQPFGSPTASRSPGHATERGEVPTAADSGRSQRMTWKREGTRKHRPILKKQALGLTSRNNSAFSCISDLQDAGASTAHGGDADASTSSPSFSLGRPAITSKGDTAGGPRPSAPGNLPPRRRSALRRSLSVRFRDVSATDGGADNRGAEGGDWAPGAESPSGRPHAGGRGIVEQLEHAHAQHQLQMHKSRLASANRLQQRSDSGSLRRITFAPYVSYATSTNDECSSDGSLTAAAAAFAAAAASRGEPQLRSGPGNGPAVAAAPPVPLPLPPSQRHLQNDAEAKARAQDEMQDQLRSQMLQWSTMQQPGPAPHTAGITRTAVQKGTEEDGPSRGSAAGIGPAQATPESGDALSLRPAVPLKTIAVRQKPATSHELEGAGGAAAADGAAADKGGMRSVWRATLRGLAAAVGIKSGGAAPLPSLAPGTAGATGTTTAVSQQDTDVVRQQQSLGPYNGEVPSTPSTPAIRLRAVDSHVFNRRRVKQKGPAVNYAKKAGILLRGAKGGQDRKPPAMTAPTTAGVPTTPCPVIPAAQTPTPGVEVLQAARRTALFVLDPTPLPVGVSAPAPAAAAALPAVASNAPRRSCTGLEASAAVTGGPAAGMRQGMVESEGTARGKSAHPQPLQPVGPPKPAKHQSASTGKMVALLLRRVSLNLNGRTSPGSDPSPIPSPDTSPFTPSPVPAAPRAPVTDSPVAGWGPGVMLSASGVGRYSLRTGESWDTAGCSSPSGGVGKDGDDATTPGSRPSRASCSSLLSGSSSRAGSPRGFFSTRVAAADAWRAAGGEPEAMAEVAGPISRVVGAEAVRGVVLPPERLQLQRAASSRPSPGDLEEGTTFVIAQS